jgi:hypothetical protein
LEENLKTKMSFRKFGFVFGLVGILSLLISITAYAKTGEPIVELFRLGGTHVEIKITFPDGISGNFTGFVNGNAFDCATIPPNVVDCIGPYQQGAGASTFFLIDQSTKETILKQVVSPPKPPTVPSTKTPPLCLGQGAGSTAITNPCLQ